jgi:hypothetical protein
MKFNCKINISNVTQFANLYIKVFIFSKDAFPENNSSFEERSNFNQTGTLRWVVKVIIDVTDMLEERSSFPVFVIATHSQLDCITL